MQVETLENQTASWKVMNIITILTWTKGNEYYHNTYVNNR